MQPRYVSCTETAKLVRAALKRSFPRTKFSVRSDRYAGGASIDVSWIDGPMPSLVEKVVAPYSGGGFDGMIDMAYSKYSWLMPDGTATRAKVKGTEASAGTVPSEQFLQPSFKSEFVRFMADYIHTNRRYSPGFYQRAVERVARRYGVDLAVKVSQLGTPMLDGDPRIGQDWASTYVYRELIRRMPAEV